VALVANLHALLAHFGAPAEFAAPTKLQTAALAFIEAKS